MLMDEVEKTRLRLITNASESVADFVDKNKAVLPQLVDATLEQLKAENIDGILTSSYQLFSSARNFGRDDITFVAEMLYKAMKQTKFSSEPKVLVAFEVALDTLGKSSTTDSELLKEMSDNIYDTLRKYNS